MRPMKNRPHIGAMLLEFDHGVFFYFIKFWFLDRVVGGPPKVFQTP